MTKPHREDEQAEQRFNELLHKALATPPISNDILKRSKESRSK